LTAAFAVVVALAGSSGCKSASKPAAPPPPPAENAPASQQVLGLPDGWELAPAATYSASQTADEVTLKARGEHPAANYEAKLFPSPLRIWPPQYLLGRHQTGEIGAQVITPFETSASFNSTDPVQQLRVSDAAGGHDIQVMQ